MTKYTAILACGNYQGVVGFAKAKGPSIPVALQKVLFLVVILVFEWILWDADCFSAAFSLVIISYFHDLNANVWIQSSDRCQIVNVMQCFSWTTWSYKS